MRAPYTASLPSANSRAERRENGQTRPEIFIFAKKAHPWRGRNGPGAGGKRRDLSGHDTGTGAGASIVESSLAARQCSEARKKPPKNQTCNASRETHPKIKRDH
jgi:hypothetical protein